MVYLRLLYKLCLFLLTPNRTSSKHNDIFPKTLLIVRLDGFGDYVLFRNFLYWLKSNPRYKDYKLTLVGNIIWREFAECFDNKAIDKFIWIDRKKFIKSFSYRNLKLQEINNDEFEVALYPTFLRETMYGDSIIRSVNAKEKVASVGDVKYRFLIEDYFTNKCYDKLVPVSSGILFEFERVREFFLNYTCDSSVNLVTLGLQVDQVPINFDYPYIVLFVGASSYNRKWSLVNFMKLAKVLFEYYSIKILICGIDEDVENDIEIAEEYIVNLIGKTSQLELVMILSNAKFVVSNETVVPHLCVALNTDVFVIFNGNNFGRFTPYPMSITNRYYVINHPFIDENQQLYTEISNQHYYVTKLDINAITVEQVYSTIIDNIEV